MTNSTAADKVNTPLSGKKILVILRHANSLHIVQDYVQRQGGNCVAVALDPIEAPNGVASAIDDIRAALPDADIVVLGTKVYDTAKEGPSRLFDFLDILKSFGLGQKPVCLTHLQSFLPETTSALRETGLNILWCENDNLKRDGMNKLGPIIAQGAAR